MRIDVGRARDRQGRPRVVPVLPGNSMLIPFAACGAGDAFATTAPPPIIPSASKKTPHRLDTPSMTPPLFLTDAPAILATSRREKGQE